MNEKQEWNERRQYRLQCFKRRNYVGRLKPGERIPEQKLAQQLGLSRTPVKEALTQLAAEGVVEMIPNKFSRVAVYGEEETVKIE